MSVKNNHYMDIKNYGNTAAGYLISNTSDLMKWIKRVNLIFDFESFPISAQNDYFAEWHIDTEYVYHGGNNPNYSSYVCVSRDEPMGVFVLSAKAGDSAEKIADALYRMQRGEAVKIGLYIVFHLSPVSWRYCFVWFPGSLIFFIGMVSLLAFYLIVTSAVCFINNV